MANTTFSGPVRSLNGFISFGPKAVVSLTADTTLTVATHAGRIITTNDADGVFTLPSITSGSSADVAGGNDYNVLSNLGCTYTFWVQTLATDMDIKTDGTDRFFGAVFIGIDSENTGETFLSSSGSNDVLTMNGTTKGGIVGSFVQFTAISSAAYYVTGSLIGSGSIATPFADS
jgi:hypothetical protein